MNAVVTYTPDEFVIPPLYLEAALARAGVRASALARRMGVEVGTISRWRRGVVPLSKARWMAVLAVLKLPLDFQPEPGFRAPENSTGRPRAKARSRKSKPH